MKAKCVSETRNKNNKPSLLSNILQARYLYLLLMPGLIYYAIFCYLPMAGLMLAFKKYNASLGILGSQWIGFANYTRLFRSPDFVHALINTIIISAGRLVIEFPFPIILAILLSEMRILKLKRIYQTVLTFPYFLSWVIVGSILTTFFSSSGPMNFLLSLVGLPKTNILASGSNFRWFIFGTSIWKNAGWSCIIYLAAIAGINPELYEAAIVDGASRLHRIWHITLPGLKTTITILFILAVGNIMNAGFDQIFNIFNPAVYPVADILDTYVYRITFMAAPDYGFSTAVGLLKSVINFALLFLADRVSKYVSGSGLFA